MTSTPWSAGPIPVVHSVVDGKALGNILCDRYTFDTPFDCQLLVRGVNDVYLIRAGQTRFVARVWRSGLRSNGEVDFETSYLVHLHQSGLNVSHPLPDRDGGAFFVVDAPEGPRQVSVFTWAHGRSFANVPTPATASAIGADLARIHLASETFVPPIDRPVDFQVGIRKTFGYVESPLADRPGEYARYRKIADAVLDMLESGPARDLPRHPIHGDFHARNVFVENGQPPLFLDFDACGQGPFLTDITSFIWANPYIALDPACNKLSERTGEDFMSGYESVRPLSPSESQLLAFYILAKEINFLGAKWSSADKVGPNTFLNAGWDWFADSIRRHVAEAGLLV